MHAVVVLRGQPPSDSQPLFGSGLHSMFIFTMIFATVLAGFAVHFGWTAYRIQFRDRTDLIRLGSRASLQATPLKSKFAAVHAVQSAVLAATATVICCTGSVWPALQWFMFASAANMIWRGVLIRALEYHEASRREVR